jgi:hypothetical protein
MEQFNEKVDKILLSFAEYLLNKKHKVREVFKNAIRTEILEDEIELIPLKEFINILQHAGIDLDTIDIYCIFTKLKYNDDHEAIDLSKLLDEMCNYGIFEESKEEEKPKDDDLFSRLRRYLTDKDLTFDNFLFNVIGRVTMQQVNGKLLRVIGLNDFEAYLQTCGVVERITDAEKGLILVSNGGEVVDLQKVKEIVEKNEVEVLKVNKTEGVRSVDDSLDLRKFDDSDGGL